MTGIAIGTLGLAFWAQPAVAKKAEEAATAIGTATARGHGGIASATATCPPGTKVVGGGFQAPSGADVIPIVYESVRVKKRAWRASAQLLDLNGPSGLTLTTYAYCESKAPKAKRRRAGVETTGVPQLGPAATASCRSGETALSGGFKMPAPLIDTTLTALVLDSHRAGESGWTTRVATGSAAPGTFTTEVYCARGDVAGVERAATSPINTSFLAPSTATASCAPSAERTGGFAQPLSELVSFLIIHESRRVDGGWRVTGLHSGMDPGVAVSALAYCG